MSIEQFESDKYGIKKIYPDAEDEPDQVYHDMDHIRGGRVDRFKNIDTYEKSNEDVPGGFEATMMKGLARLALYSNNGNPFGSVEHTVYFKFERGPDKNGGHNNENRLFQPYIGGGAHHTNKKRCCEGNAMKICIWGGGDISFRKEICHEAYCNPPDRGNWNDFGDDESHGEWNGPPRNMKNDKMTKRWYGFKQIEKHLDGRKNRQEVWMDEGADDGNGKLVLEGNENRWRLIAAYEDVKTDEKDNQPVNDWKAGDWHSECGECDEDSRSRRSLPNGYVRLKPFWVTHEREDPQFDHEFEVKKANCVSLRTDEKGEPREVKIAYWSLRKIKPTQTPESPP